ncbi:glycosyltransferase [Flavihumibacter profundi]|uniref:glycosyltransferase n=1 Tax=Flavihumibacter profundi TaxID=2716883 RepID=UPI001CC3DC52|nr:glycosyltransferase [Flavihumibacter profundi]MBZ5858446.1 glycosyltransferase [Flavihumibacter profundi]
MSSTRQIFHTGSNRRWARFKWSLGLLLALISILLLTLIASLWMNYHPDLPVLYNRNEQLKSILKPNENFILENKINREYAGFRSFIAERKDSMENKQSWVKSNQSAPVRAAFYVAWDAQSYFSLRNNISKLNMVLPEWLFIDPNADTVYTNIDQRGLKVIRESGVRIVPMLSNFFNNDFDGEAVHRIISNPLKRKQVIASVLNILLSNHFDGINVDFEELKEKTDENLVAFQRELYTALHQKGLLVSQDISPFNEDYNYRELSRYNDNIFLMAYDEHNSESKPGPISSQKWIEAAMDAAASEIPSEKIILCIAAYGYDWPKGGAGTDITYQEALTTASESDAKPEFDNDTYNLHYTYYDDNNLEHEVYFTDAATNFNTLRFAAEYGISGVAMWRLGSEDSRLWQFYDNDATKAGLKNFDLAALNHVKESNDVDYIGEGEILDVKSNPTPGKIAAEIDSSELLISEEKYISLPSMFVVKKFGTANKKIVLTFDDGPDPTYTPRILDILHREHVPAAFFMVGLNAENNIPLVKQVYSEGHELGNHSFTHPNMAEVSTTRAELERKLTRLLIECITGHSTLLFRAPYNADSEPETMEELKPVADSRVDNYLTVGESIDPNDWEPGVTADTILSRIIQQQKNGNIILLHDAGGNREATVQALPRIIEYFKGQGYQFTTVAGLLGKKELDLMPAVPQKSGFYLIKANYFLADIGYYLSRFLNILFFLFIAAGVLRLSIMAVLALKKRKKDREALPLANLAQPFVSVIIPAYNEEVNAVRSLDLLLQTDYPNIEFIFVDDGSKDNTYDKVWTAFHMNKKVKILRKPNGGKASALNYGIQESTAEFVVCIDADTHLLPDAISRLMENFTHPNVGAVAGQVKVGNEVNLLTRWQSIEYTTAQNFDRQAMAAVNAITVVPGAIGAFRKEALLNAGGFTTDTLAEDCDLTIRMLLKDYTVTEDSRAIAITEAPESLSMLLKQRYRWSYGVLQTSWKHRKALFNTRHKWLGFFALPNIILFQFIIPVFAPIADLLMIIGLLTGNEGKIILYYLLFMLIDLSIALMAFILAEEPVYKLLWLLPQRIIYRWLMVWVLFKSYFRALKGELHSWGALKRTGNIGPDTIFKTPGKDPVPQG